MPDTPTREELLEILGQLGIVLSQDYDDADLYEMILAAGVDPETIEAEVAEHRGRRVPGRPE